MAPTMSFDSIIVSFFLRHHPSKRQKRRRRDNGRITGSFSCLSFNSPWDATLVARRSSLDKRVLFRTEIPTPCGAQAGLIDRNEWHEPLDGPVDRSSFRMMRFSAGGAKAVVPYRSPCVRSRARGSHFDIWHVLIRVLRIALAPDTLT